MRTGGIFKFSKIWKGTLHIIMEDDNGDQYDPIPFLDARFQFDEDQVEIVDEEFGSKFICKIDKVKDNTSLVYGTGVVTAAIVTGAVRSKGTVTMNTPLANVYAFGTITCATVVAGNTVTVNGNVYTATVGEMRTHADFKIGTTNTITAENLVRAINGDPRPGTVAQTLVATNIAGVVTVTTNLLGVAGNATTLVSSGSTLAVTGSGTLTSGVTADTVVINGLTFTAVEGTPSDYTQFSVDSTTTAQAISLAAAINADTRIGTIGTGMFAVASVAAVEVTQKDATEDLDATTLVTTGGARLTVSGATFASYVAGDTITANGRIYTAVVGAKRDNTEFSKDTSDTATADDFVLSYNNDTRTETLGACIASNIAGAITLTQSIYDHGDDTTLVSSNGTRLAVTAVPFANSVDAFISSTGVAATDKAAVSTALQAYVGVTPV